MGHEDLEKPCQESCICHRKSMGTLQGFVRTSESSNAVLVQPCQNHVWKKKKKTKQKHAASTGKQKETGNQLPVAPDSQLNF